MSKYIDIVGIVRDNDEFTLQVVIYDKKKENEISRSPILNCESFSTGLLLVNGNHAEFFYYEKESREMRAKRLCKFLRLNRSNESVLVKINNDYSFWLDDREWRGSHE